ncbi:MAG TPA: hypothetical protein VFX30_05410 [bacterium]|nr:hypothetical protein [bacterium]
MASATVVSSGLFFKTVDEDDEGEDVEDGDDEAPGANVDREDELEDPEEDAAEPEDAAEAVAEAGRAGKVPPKTGADAAPEDAGAAVTAAGEVEPRETMSDVGGGAAGVGGFALSALRVRGLRDVLGIGPKARFRSCRRSSSRSLKSATSSPSSGCRGLSSTSSSSASSAAFFADALVLDGLGRESSGRIVSVASPP